MSESPGLQPRERQALAALRYAVNEEAASYLAIMRLFTAGMGGFLSDQSAHEVAERLAQQGLPLDQDTVEARLSYLADHGNLARSPRETEARTVREYLSNRARYQLTQRGELVHRQVEALLEHSEQAREVSSEVLPSILGGVEQLLGLVSAGFDTVEPRELSARVTTMFAQFEVLVASTRQFYSYLSTVLTRFDLGRDEFVAFKTVLIDYLQRFVDEVSRHMPQLADTLRRLEPSIGTICARAAEGERLVDVDGALARRATGLQVADWRPLQAWFVGGHGRRPDADNVRSLATEAMRSLLANLRRLAAGADRRQSRYADLIQLARWFDQADDARAHQLWAGAFGLYSARHVDFAAEDDSNPVPATATWWQAPVAEVPMGLRKHGERKAGGRAGTRVDYSAAKATRFAERRRAHERHQAALNELAQHSGVLGAVSLSVEGQDVLLELYARALTGHGRPLRAGETARGEAPLSSGRLVLTVRADEGRDTVLATPEGRLTLTGLRLEVSDVSDVRHEVTGREAHG